MESRWPTLQLDDLQRRGREILREKMATGRFSTEPVIRSFPPGPSPTELAAGLAVVKDPAILERLQDYAKAATGAYASNTRRALLADTEIWAEWCARLAHCPLPAEPRVVARFIDEMGATNRKPATVRRYLASLAHLHRAAKLPDPTRDETVLLAMRRLARAKSTRQRQAAGITEGDVAAILVSTGRRLIDRRNLALLLVGRDLLARRSELVALRVEDVEFDPDGSANVLIRRGKTDQEGEGAMLWLSDRAVEHLKDWLNQAGILEGPIFRSIDRQGRLGGPLGEGEVSRIFKRLALAAQLDDMRISGHSVRIGMAQDLVASGAALPSVMQAGRWKSARMPARYSEKQAAKKNAVAQYYRGG